MKSLLKISFLLLTFSITTASISAQTFKNEKGIAINGYDVVAYHTQYSAVRGSNDFSLKHGDATFYFSSAENKAAFKASPEKYLPKYDGYCAFAVAAMDSKVPSSPGTFKIHNGDLYLFFNDFYEGKPFNTIVPWNGDEANLIAKAEANWKKK